MASLWWPQPDFVPEEPEFTLNLLLTEVFKLLWCVRAEGGGLGRQWARTRAHSTVDRRPRTLDPRPTTLDPRPSTLHLDPPPLTLDPFDHDSCRMIQPIIDYFAFEKLGLVPVWQWVNPLRSLVVFLFYIWLFYKVQLHII